MGRFQRPNFCLQKISICTSQQEHKRNIHEREYRQSNYVMSMKNNRFSKQYMDKHFKYQRSSLNITILNVRSNVLLNVLFPNL